MIRLIWVVAEAARDELPKTLFRKLDVLTGCVGTDAFMNSIWASVSPKLLENYYTNTPLLSR